MKIDWQAAMSGKRPVRDAGGEQLRVVCTDGNGPFPVILEDRYGNIHRCRIDCCDLRLTQDPEVIERVGWCFVSKDGASNLWDNKDEALAQFKAFRDTFIVPPFPVTARIETIDGKTVVTVSGKSE